MATSKSQKRGRTSKLRTHGGTLQSPDRDDDRDWSSPKARGAISKTFDMKTLHVWLQWHNDPKVIVAAIVTAVVLNKVAPEDMITIDAYRVSPKENEYWNVQIQYQIVPGNKTQWANSMVDRYFEQISARQVLGGNVVLSDYAHVSIDYVNVRNLYDAIDAIFNYTEWDQNIKFVVRPLPELTNWGKPDFLRHEVTVRRFGDQRIVESSMAHLDAPLTQRFVSNMSESALEAVRDEMRSDVDTADGDISPMPNFYTIFNGKKP